MDLPFLYLPLWFTGSFGAPMNPVTEFVSRIARVFHIFSPSVALVVDKVDILLVVVAASSSLSLFLALQPKPDLPAFGLSKLG